MAVFGRTYLAVAALCVSSATLGAQVAPAKPTCDVAENASGDAARATLSINIARAATTPTVAATNLKSAVMLLEHMEKGDNPVVNAYVLGSALSLWGNQPGIGLAPKRSAVGFTVNPTGTLDLPFTLDSLFRIVEVAKPICTDYTAYWRAGQKFYLDVVNGAINSLNADKLDSAEAYAKQANQLYAPSPYGTMVFGSVASKRGDNAKAVEYWLEAAAIAAKDSSYRDVRRQMLANVGSVYMNTALTATGAEKVAAARKAADIYAQLLAVPGTKGQYVIGGRQNLQSAYFLAGDTAAAAKTWEALIADPASYEYQDLLNSAVNASRASRLADAGKLFEGVLQQNPYNRDAMYNLAVTYLTLEQNDKVPALIKRLVAVDPGNPENFNLAARAYLAIGREAAKAKKTAVAAAYNDSTVTWYNNGNKLGVDVYFTEFSPSDKQVQIRGVMTDRRDKADANVQTPPPPPVKGKRAPKPAPKVYPPKMVTLKFEALDRSGAVVGSESVTSDSMTPGKTSKFSVTITGQNIYAYRYTVVD